MDCFNRNTNSSLVKWTNKPIRLYINQLLAQIKMDFSWHLLSDKIYQTKIPRTWINNKQKLKSTRERKEISDIQFFDSSKSLRISEFWIYSISWYVYTKKKGILYMETKKLTRGATLVINSAWQGLICPFLTFNLIMLITPYTGPALELIV